MQQMLSLRVKIQSDAYPLIRHISPITDEERPRNTTALKRADHLISFGSIGGIVINGL
jgi:hypothetical protein